MMNSYRIKSYLSNDETVLWEGDSGGRINFNGNGVAFVSQFIFGLVFAGFALFWMIMAFTAASNSGGAAFLFPLFGLPFLIVGLALSFGTIIKQKRKYKDCLYVVTNKRILAFVKTGMESIDLKRIETVNIVYGKDGRGWLNVYVIAPMFNHSEYYNNSRGYRHSVSSVNRNLFLIQDVDDVLKVYQIIVNAKDNALNGNNLRNNDN